MWHEPETFVDANGHVNRVQDLRTNPGLGRRSWGTEGSTDCDGTTDRWRVADAP